MSIQNYNNQVANADAKIPAQRSISDLGQVLAKKMGQIKSVVATSVTPEKMARIALNELRTNTYLAKIAMANPDSFVNSVLQASHLGLEIGGALGQAYLVPYKSEIKMIPGYRGLLTLARRSGFITSIKAEMVYEHDAFDLELGIEPKVVHKPLLTGDRGDPKLVYMVAHFKDGGHHFEWMAIEDVNKIRDRSPSSKNGPWVTDYVQMCLKTVIRRGWKYLPMSIEMQKAEVIEHAVDTGASLIIEGDSVEINTVSGSDTEKNESTKMLPPESIAAIEKELLQAADNEALDTIAETRFSPFTRQMTEADIDRLNAAYEKRLNDLNA